jgi:tRNA pseudouridine synthase 10
MDVLDKALGMMDRYPLCDNCLGRQFAALGYGIENSKRGQALKTSLVLRENSLIPVASKNSIKNLKTIATNGFSSEAKKTLGHLNKRVPKTSVACYLCSGAFQKIDELAQETVNKSAEYEYSTFLVGVDLPNKVEEREDEFKAEFEVKWGESIKHEFGRVMGKRIADLTGKQAEYGRPDVTFLISPFTKEVKLQVNPLFVAGRYRKTVRTIPQSKWYCGACRGKGCEKCGGTGKLYSESVEELVSKPLLDAALGEKTSFHASGREDIDARMLGTGRPFVAEISRPKKRLLDLRAVRESINLTAKGKTRVSTLRFSNRDVVRRLKKAESAQKEYRVTVEFEHKVPEKTLLSLESKLSSVQVRQRTPLRVMHRRADLVRERYIYKVKVRRLSPKKAELQIRCQGGLYVKELVSGDEGRTVPSVSELLENKAKPLRLDVLSVIMEDKHIGET